MAWCHCFARCYVNVDKIRILFLFWPLLGETEKAAARLAVDDLPRSSSKFPSSLAGDISAFHHFQHAPKGHCLQVTLKPELKSKWEAILLHSGTQHVRNLWTLKRSHNVLSSLSQPFFIEFWSTHSPYVTGILREHWNEINWKGTLDPANSAVDFFFPFFFFSFSWAGRGKRTGETLMCLKKYPCLLEVWTLLSWRLLVTSFSNSPYGIIEGFLFWHLWKFEVSYSSQVMIILITCSTSEQHVCNNPLIIIKISVMDS